MRRTQRLSRVMPTAALAMMALAAGCSSVPPLVQKPLASADRTALRDSARELVRPSCGSCHTGSLPTAKPAALAVFDLEDEDFAAGMGEEELQVFLRRAHGSLDEPGRALLRVFLEDELARASAR